MAQLDWSTFDPMAKAYANTWVYRLHVGQKDYMDTPLLTVESEGIVGWYYLLDDEVLTVWLTNNDMIAEFVKLARDGVRIWRQE